MYFVKTVFMSLLIFNISVFCDSFGVDIFDPDFNMFTSQFCEKKSIDEFCAFYREISSKLGSLSKNKKKRVYSKIRSIALSAIEVKRHDIFDKFSELKIKKVEDVNVELQPMINLFLIRFGTLEIFYEYRAQRHKNVWQRSKSYFSGAKHQAMNIGSSIKNFVKKIFQ